MWSDQQATFFSDMIKQFYANQPVLNMLICDKIQSENIFINL